MKKKDAELSSWRERRSFYPDDERLRKWGFRIEHRRRGEEPVWSLMGEQYTQSAALAMCEESEKVVA